jgi:hypothetical protein
MRAQAGVLSALKSDTQMQLVAEADITHLPRCSPDARIVMN